MATILVSAFSLGSDCIAMTTIGEQSLEFLGHQKDGNDFEDHVDPRFVPTKRTRRESEEKSSSRGGPEFAG